MPPQKRQRAAAAPPARGGRGGGRGGRGGGGREDEDADDGDRVADSDDESDGAAARDGEEEEEDAEAAETAAEKRLRLAKAYLANLRTELAADKARKRSNLSDDDEGSEGEEGEGGDDGELGARLATDAQQARGDRQRELAGRVSVPRAPAGGAPPEGALWRGHRLAVTALALADDDATAWSASKDGALLRWDVETGARTRLPQPPPVPTKGVRGSARMRLAAAAP
jgi:ribosomal RNA-processing protein 9